MIKYFKILIILFYSFLITNANSSDQKIVYLNLDYIVQNSVPGQLIIQDLENKKKINVEKFKLKENKLRDKEEDIIKKKILFQKKNLSLKF